MTGEAQVGVPDATDVLDTAEAGGKAIRGGSLRVAGYAAGAVVTLVSVPLLVRHLGLADFGRYSTVVSLIAIVAGVTEAGLGSVAMREYAARTEPDRSTYMRDVLGARIALSLAGVVGALAFAVLVGYADDMVVGTGVAGIGLVIGVLNAQYVVPLAAGLRLGWVTTGDFLRTLGNTLIVVALVIAGAGIVAFLAAPILPAVAIALLMLWLVRGQLPALPAFHPRRWWRLLRDTLPLAVATAVGALYFRMAIVVMSLLAPAVETGYFATSYRLVEALLGVPFLLIGVTFPVLARAARDDRERLRYASQRIFEVALLAGVWISLATALGAGIAMSVIGGPDAEPAADVLRIQACFVTVSFLTLTWQSLLLVQHMHREMLISASIAMVVVLASTLVLIPPFEAEGAAVAVVVGETVLMAAQAALLWRVHGDLRPSAAVVPKVAVALACALAASLLLFDGEIVRVLVATAVYFGLLAALRAIPTELFAALAGRPPEPAQ